MCLRGMRLRGMRLRGMRLVFESTVLMSAIGFGNGSFQFMSFHSDGVDADSMCHGS